MPDGPRYDDDFYAWTQYQAEVLRSMECEGNGFDRGNVAEEIEALGRSQLHDAFGLVRKTLTSLLLIAHGPAGRRRYGWMYEIAGWRAELEDKRQYGDPGDKRRTNPAARDLAARHFFRSIAPSNHLRCPQASRDVTPGPSLC